jgi:hypothetical protein
VTACQPWVASYRKEWFCLSAFSFYASPKQTMAKVPEPSFPVGGKRGFDLRQCRGVRGQSASGPVTRCRPWPSRPVHPGRGKRGHGPARGRGECRAGLRISAKHGPAPSNRIEIVCSYARENCGRPEWNTERAAAGGLEAPTGPTRLACSRRVVQSNTAISCRVVVNGREQSCVNFVPIYPQVHDTFTQKLTQTCKARSLNPLNH